MAGEELAGAQAGVEGGMNAGAQMAGEETMAGVEGGMNAGAQMAGEEVAGVMAGVEGGMNAGAQMGGMENPDDGLERFNDPDLIDLSNSYPGCFESFHHAQITFESIFRRFFEGLNDGSIVFNPMCNHNFDLLNTFPSNQFDFSNVDVTDNGCYEFTGFSLVTPHLHGIEGLQSKYFVKDTRYNNEFILDNDINLWGVVGFSQRGMDANNTTCEEQ